MRSWLISLSLSCASVILALGLLEAALQLMHYGDNQPNRLREFIEYDPLLGWKNKRNCSGDVHTTEYQLRVEYNAKGVRGLERDYAKPPQVFRVVILGDSFVDAWMVQTQDRMSEVLEKTLGPLVQVIALGVAGYSTDQELLLLETEGWKYQPDLVVLAFYFNDVLYNDNHRVASGVEKPVFAMDYAGNLTLTNVPVPRPVMHALKDKLKLYELIRTAVISYPWLYSLAAKAGLAYLPRANALPSKLPDEFMVYDKISTPQLKRIWGVTQALLRRMKEETDKRKVKLVVFYVPEKMEVYPDEWTSSHIPPQYDPGEVARNLVRICRAEDIPYIEPSERFREVAQKSRLYYKYDIHWNPAGHRLAGEMLAEYIKGFVPGVANKSAPGHHGLAGAKITP